MGRYSEEEKEFFKEYVPGHHYSEIKDEFIRRFNRAITIRQVSACIKRYGLKTGFTGQFPKGSIPANKGKRMPPEVYEKCRHTMFKPGNKPHNTREVGSTVARKDGYIYVKVRNDCSGKGNLEPLQKAVWEDHNGPVPEEMMVMFLDGDRSNCGISNLALISRAEHAVLNHRKRRSPFPEVTKANIALTKLELATAKRGKGKCG